MSEHWDRCMSRVTRYADDLWATVRAKRLNASAVEGLIDSFLEQPAYYPEWRSKLHEIAMRRREMGDPSPDTGANHG